MAPSRILLNHYRVVRESSYEHLALDNILALWDNIWALWYQDLSLEDFKVAFGISWPRKLCDFRYHVVGGTCSFMIAWEKGCGSTWNWIRHGSACPWHDICQCMACCNSSFFFYNSSWARNVSDATAPLLHTISLLLVFPLFSFLFSHCHIATHCYRISCKVGTWPSSSGWTTCL